MKEVTHVTQSEDQLQAAIFQHHWNNFPEQRRLLFHVNNKARNRIEGAHMKAKGVVPGVSDLIYLRPGGKPVLMELKTDTGAQSDEQIEWQEAVEAAGYEYVIVRSVTQAHDIFCHLKTSP